MSVHCCVQRTAYQVFIHFKEHLCAFLASAVPLFIIQSPYHTLNSTDVMIKARMALVNHVDNCSRQHCSDLEFRIKTSRIKNSRIKNSRINVSQTANCHCNRTVVNNVFVCVCVCVCVL